MKWPQASIREVAPPERAAVSFSDDQEVWSLSLDQIESHTGRILGKQRIRAGDAGTSTFPFDTEHVLYSKLRPYLNKVVRPDEPGLATTELVPLRPKRDLIDAGFLTFYLRSDSFVRFATNMVAGAKMPRMVMDRFWVHQLPLPPLSEQRRMVDLLEQADALRRRRADADSLGERVLPELFHKMFGDPLSNPRGLPTDSFNNLLACLRNGTTFEQNQLGRGHPVTRIETISAGVIDPARVRYVEMEDAAISKWKLEIGDILFSHINSESHIGKTAIYRGSPSPLIHGMNLLLMRSIKNRIMPEYLFAALNCDSVRAAFRQRCKRAVNQASLNQNDIATMEIVVPKMEDQQRFCSFAESLLRDSENRQCSSKSLETLFQVLVHRAFTGELTAGWREAHMKELLAEMGIQARHLASAQA